MAAEFISVLNPVLQVQQKKSWFRFLALAVSVTGGGENVLISIQSWLNMKLIRRKKNEEFSPALPLVSVGTSITEAEESLKLEAPSP